MKSKYSTLKFFIRIALQVEIWEYHYLDLIYQLQGNPASKTPGWANFSNEFAGYLLGKSPRQIQRLKKEMAERGLILRNTRTGEVQLTIETWNAMQAEEIDQEMIGQLAPKDQEAIHRALYGKGRHNVAPSTTLRRPKDDIMSPNNNRDSNNDKEEEEPKDFFDLKEEILRKNLLEESISNRMEIQKTVEKFYNKKWFQEQFKYCWPTPTHQPIGIIVNGWIQTGHWDLVRNFKLNKISGWMNSTGKNFNQPHIKTENENGNRKAKSKRRRANDYDTIA